MLRFGMSGRDISEPHQISPKISSTLSQITSTKIEPSNPEINDDLETTADDQPISGWSFLGFELFDLIIVLIHALVIWATIPMEWLFEIPLLRFVAGAGFFVSLYFLGQTKQYALGVSSISRFHGSLWFVMLVGGAISGTLVFGVFIVGPAKDLLNSVGIIDMSVLTFVAIPFGVISLGMIPHIAIRADEKLSTPDFDGNGFQDDTEPGDSRSVEQLGKDPSLGERDSNVLLAGPSFIKLPAWATYLGRAMFLLAATILLFYVEKGFDGSTDDFAMRLLLSTFMLSVFYIPVRIQEMFMRPQGPYFQSLIQTIVAVAMMKSSVVYF